MITLSEFQSQLLELGCNAPTDTVIVMEPCAADDEERQKQRASNIQEYEQLITEGLLEPADKDFAEILLKLRIEHGRGARVGRMTQTAIAMFRNPHARMVN